MLVKLLKYELMASARAFVPFYIALFGVAAVNAIIIMVMPSAEISNIGVTIVSEGVEQTFSIIQALLVFVYYALSMALSIITFVLLVNRFRKALLGSEGYLMFTLPVSTDLHIISKLISALFWIIVTGIIMSFTSALLVLSLEEYTGAIREFFTLFTAEDFRAVYNHSIIEVLALFIFTAITSSIVIILLVYFSLAVGHMAKKHKFVLAVSVFFAVTTIANITIMVHFFQNLEQHLDNFTPSITNEAQYVLARFFSQLVFLFPFLLFCACIFTVAIIIFYIGTRYILKNKLNLD